jgi:hypothetical protein
MNDLTTLTIEVLNNTDKRMSPKQLQIMRNVLINNTKLTKKEVNMMGNFELAVVFESVQNPIIEKNKKSLKYTFIFSLVTFLAVGMYVFMSL